MEGVGVGKGIVYPLAVSGAPSCEKLSKQRDICNILPVCHVKKMGQQHWQELFLKEVENSPDVRAFGNIQSHITLDHRFHIVNWMSEACGVLGWTSLTFFVGVNAMDQYIAKTRHEILPSELGALAAACLYYGANLMESATDENVYTLERFRQLCPEVGSEDSLRNAQVHLLDVLQGANLSRKTPMDFCLLFLAQMQIAEEPVPQVFRHLVGKEMLGVTFDMCSVASLCLYTSGDSLMFRGSHVVAAVLYKVVEFLCPAFASELPLRDQLCKQVFYMPGGWSQLSPYVQTFTGSIRELSETLWQQPLQRPKRKNSNITKPQDWFRHIHPANISNLEMSKVHVGEAALPSVDMRGAASTVKEISGNQRVRHGVEPEVSSKHHSASKPPAQVAVAKTRLGSNRSAAGAGASNRSVPAKQAGQQCCTSEQKPSNRNARSNTNQTTGNQTTHSTAEAKQNPSTQAVQKLPSESVKQLSTYNTIRGLNKHPEATMAVSNRVSASKPKTAPSIPSYGQEPPASNWNLPKQQLLLQASRTKGDSMQHRYNLRSRRG